MAVPKKRTTRSRRNMRRSHISLPIQTISSCKHCGSAKLFHHVCHTCGWYKDKFVFKHKTKEEKQVMQEQIKAWLEALKTETNNSSEINTLNEKIEPTKVDNPIGE